MRNTLRLLITAALLWTSTIQAADTPRRPQFGMKACIAALTLASVGLGLYAPYHQKRQRHQVVVRALDESPRAVAAENRELVRAAVLAGIEEVGFDRILTLVRDESEKRAINDDAKEEVRRALIDGRTIPEWTGGEELKDIPAIHRLRWSKVRAFKYRKACELDIVLAKKGIYLDDLYEVWVENLGELNAGSTSAVGHWESTAAATLEKTPEHKQVVIEAMVDYIQSQIESGTLQFQPTDSLAERSWILRVIQLELD